MAFISSRSWASMADSPMPNSFRVWEAMTPLGQGLEIGDRPVVEHGEALAGGRGA